MAARNNIQSDAPSHSAQSTSLGRNAMVKPVISLLAAFWICTSCARKPPADAFCTYEPLPQTTDAAAGQGAIQILAPTDEYFYVFDEAGKQIGYGSMNRALAVKPG